jgi:hypothetical protein
VRIPADVQLDGYPRIGIVTFSGSNGELSRLTTQQLQQAVLEAQPGVRLVELGPEDEVLRSINRNRFNAESLRMIASEHALDAMFVGDLQISEVTPNVDLRNLSLGSVTAGAEVQAILSVRLVEGEGGGTMWSDSSTGTISVAHANFDFDGRGGVGFRDRNAELKQLVQGLAANVTGDFRDHFVKRRVDDVPPHYVPSYSNDGVEIYGPPTALSQANP